MLPPANRGADVNSVLRHVLRSAAFESVAIEPRPNHLDSADQKHRAYRGDDPDLHSRPQQPKYLGGAQNQCSVEPAAQDHESEEVRAFSYRDFIDRRDKGNPGLNEECRNAPRKPYYDKRNPPFGPAWVSILKTYKDEHNEKQVRCGKNDSCACEHSYVP